MEKKDVFFESKTQTPTASRNFLVRERLILRLNEAEERMVIVSAGMGYGKTVLLTHYAKRYPEKCAWYHLGDTDNDIMVFTRYLSKSVSRIAPAFAPDFSPYLALEQNEAMIRNLALDFACALRELELGELCLILDDFQTVSSQWIFQFLDILWNSDPGALRLILCTKSAPPPFCARYLLERRAVVLGADELTFNLTEIRQMVAEYADPRELDEVAQNIQIQMEGWPAGVSFTALYFRQRQVRMAAQDVEHACQQRYLQDYFMHDLFRKLPFTLQQFLSCTAVLDYLRPDVCNVLAGIENAGSQLSYLEQENLFILRLSGGGRIYRYHALFRNFLLAQLQPEQRLELLRQAAAFYLRTPDKAQAVEYAIACGDGDCLRSALEEAGPEALERGQIDTLRRWLEELRRTQAEPTPGMVLLQGLYCERIGQWQAALDLAARLEEAGPQRAGERNWLEAKLLWARVAREHISPSKSLALVDEIWDHLRPERAALRGLRRQAVQLRVYDLLDMGLFDQALALALNEAEACTQRADGEGRIWSQELAVDCSFIQGEYRRAMQLYTVLRSGGAGGGAIFAALYLAVSGRAAQALEQAHQAMESGRETTLRTAAENLILTRMLIERIAVLEGLGEGAGPEKADWESWAVSGESACPETVSLLRRALQRARLERDEEERLFQIKDGRLITIQDAVRWLAIRWRVRDGERERALELCARTRKYRPERCGGTDAPGRMNAFLAFTVLEEALLLAPDRREEAVGLMEGCVPYCKANRLCCPGLSGEERKTLLGLLPAAQAPECAPAAEEDVPALRVEVRCFGRFRVLLPDGQELGWRTRKAQELFAYLFHLNGAPADRERLMDILWPQAPLENATSLLHTSLYSIRKSLAPYGLEGLILRDKRGYQLDMALLTSPRARVEEICRDETADGAQELPELYPGAYLEDIDGTWTEDGRVRFAGAVLRTCRAQAQRRMDQGDFQGAAAYLRAAVRQEPYDEALAGMLLRCYAALGETKHAMSLYARLKETLKTDLDVEPGQEVTQVYKECLLRRLGRG